MRIHFIAIGGAAMHNLAIALHLKGYTLSGSDDEIFEPSKGRLKKYGLLPESIGWDANRITPELDAIVLGMHARADNPELLKAKELGLRIYSYPEYLYEQSKDKIRIVVGGSHGKTTITAMCLHVLHQCNIDTDFMLGAQLEGFETMVRLTKDAKYILIEGDEYLSSALEPIPKFHLYRPHIAILSGIAWDHMNVFPSFENYIDQFRIFIQRIEKGGSVYWCAQDSELENLLSEDFPGITSAAYSFPDYEIIDGKTYIKSEGKSYPLSVFGEHNLLNIEAAHSICRELGIDNNSFYTAISSFKGASKRLELIDENERTAIYKDFAHSPSKLKATIKAVKDQYPDRKLTACIELHTYSSLNKAFIPLYKDSMKDADTAIVYYNPHTVAHKKLEPISEDELRQAFNQKDIDIYTDSGKLYDRLMSQNWEDACLLMMSSGNYDGIDFDEFKKITR